MGAAYDLFGTGRTAIKVALGRYPARNTGVGVNLPVSNQPTSTTIAWNDANGNFVPDCDLTNPGANGECGAWGDRTFGQVREGNTRFADDARGGFNLENYNWQGNVGPAPVAVEHGPHGRLFPHVVRRFPGAGQYASRRRITIRSASPRRWTAGCPAT